jgi:hypothetical protein
MTRKEIIATAYEDFRRTRRLPADELCREVLNLALRAAGLEQMTGGEARLVDAHIRCGWHPWPGTPDARASKPDPAEWPGWPPDDAARATGPPAVAAGVRGRATLWDWIDSDGDNKRG